MLDNSAMKIKEDAPKQSIFNIQMDIESIFAEIENNDGEITPELEAQLAISEEELRNKLETYTNMVRYYENNIATIESEKKRLDTLKNVRKHRVEKLRSIMTEAVSNYGVKGKSGNASIELWNAKLFTRNTESVNVNESRVAILNEKFFDYAFELYHAGILETGEDIDPIGIIDAINANCIAEYGEDFEPFTIDDFINTKFNITFTLSPKELVTDTQYILKASIGLQNYVNISPNINKTAIKAYIQTISQPNITIADIQSKTSVTIK